MSLWIAFVTGLGLSMDAVAASISSSITASRARWQEAIKVAFYFGLFQALMPAVGYACGALFRGWFERVDHWVAFLLLGLIGAKMIRESRRESDEGQPDNPFATTKLLLLAVTTSIDALAVGLSFSLLGISLSMMMAVIGLVTFFLCLPSVWVGQRLGTAMAKRAELLGGLVLITIGCKILIEHLSA